MGDEREDGGPFRVTDRRRFDSEGNLKDEGAASQRPAPAPTGAEPSASASAPAGEPVRPRTPDPEPMSAEADRIDFSALVMSVATTALAYMGHQPGDPNRVPGQVNLRMAAQNIDILGMLKEKTTGNLSASEAELIDSVLYDLRTLYVQTAQQQRG